MTPLAHSPALLACFGGILLIAAIQDLVQLKISNALVIALLLVALTGVAVTAPPAEWWRHLVSFGLLFGAGIFLFARGWFGGGDAKLLAASALAFPLGSLLWFVTSVAILGGLVAILLLLIRILVPQPATQASRVKALQRGSALPYGVAIAGGAILTAFYTPPAPLGQPVEQPAYLQPIDG